MGYFGHSQGLICGDTLRCLCGQRTPASSVHSSCQLGHGEGEDGQTGVVVSGGYQRLSAKMVVLISMGVEEKLVVSGVWGLLTLTPDRPDRHTSLYMTSVSCSALVAFFIRHFSHAAVCGKMFVFVTKENIRAYKTFLQRTHA